MKTMECNPCPGECMQGKSCSTCRHHCKMVWKNKAGEVFLDLMNDGYQCYRGLGSQCCPMFGTDNDWDYWESMKEIKCHGQY